MDTIILSGTGPSIRLKMASDLRKCESETPKVTVIDATSVKDVALNTDKTNLEFAA